MKAEFLVDIVPRDVPIATAVCGGRGAPQCLISPTFFADGEKRWSLSRSWRYGADVLVTPWYNAARTLEILSRARLSKARLVHYPSEQMFSNMFDHEKLNVACAAAYCRQVDAVLVWGEYYARRLVEDVGYPRHRIYEVGSPRMEFVRQGNDERRPGPTRVLFVSDFTLADLRNDRKRRTFSRTYRARITVETVAQLDEERLNMLETARRVAQMDGFEARVRPHPGESTDYYLDACQGSGVQYADPAVALSEDILWSDVVVGYTSTSIFEVIAAGRPFFALRNRPPPNIVWRDALESLYRVCSADELITKLHDPSALERTRWDLTREAGFCVGNVGGGYDPVAALRAALLHIVERDPGTALVSSDRWAVAWGVVRAACKYIALRLFGSRAWLALGLWQPEVVRRRMSPGHVLTDGIVGQYRRQMANVSTTRVQPADSVDWQLGPWCWRPVSRGRQWGPKYGGTLDQSASEHG